MGVFDDILKGAPAEDQAIFAKYPQLKQSVEKLENDYSQVSRFAGDWVNWQERNWDSESGMTRAEKALRDKLAEAQEKLDAAGQPGSGASTEQIALLRREFDERLKGLREENQRTVAGVTTFMTKAATKIIPHHTEFGEILDPQTLVDYMQKNGITNPDLAYDQMVAGRRQEIAAKRQQELKEQHQKELDEAEKRGYEKRSQEDAMGPHGVLPTDSTGGIAGVTARMEKPATISDDLKARVAEAKLGDASLAEIGYGMYRRGELPTQ